jgi:hypothetical protein
MKVAGIFAGVGGSEPVLHRTRPLVVTAEDISFHKRSGRVLADAVDEAWAAVEQGVDQ